MTLKEFYNKAVFLLQDDKIKNPSLEARMIISHVLNIDHKDFILKFEQGKISFLKKIQILKKIKKRLSGISMAYLIKKKYFYDSEFFVNRTVLIPRPETELLIDIIVQETDKNKFYYILEIGTGSGNIPIELAKKITRVDILGIDRSYNALAVAKKNIKLNNIEKDKILLKKKNFLKFKTKKKFDIIISNPPYIESNHVKMLLKNKIVSDPVISLDGGSDGLKFYRHLKYFAENNLSEDGFMIFEHGFDQKEKILEIFSDKKFKTNCYKDLNNLDRVILVRIKG